jgi:hypothetical protein
MPPFNTSQQNASWFQYAPQHNTTTPHWMKMHYGAFLFGHEWPKKMKEYMNEMKWNTFDLTLAN